MSISTGHLVGSIAQVYEQMPTKKAHKEIVRVFNTEKPHGEVMNMTAFWCAATCTALQIMAGNAQKDVPMSYSCTRTMNEAKKLGIWKEDDAFIPQVGDEVIYDWQDCKNYKNTDNHGDPDHIGTVWKVDSKHIYVIEGNKGGGIVGKRELEINGRYIRGFVHPNYAPLKKYSHVPAKPYTGKLPNSVVHFESKGDDIERVQQFLNWACDTALKIDGSCGKATTDSIIRFQYTHGLDPDGFFGPLTRAKAQELIKAHEEKTKPAETKPAETKPAETKPAISARAKKLIEAAESLTWPKGTAKKKYAWKTGQATKVFEKALNKFCPNRKNWNKYSKEGCCCDVAIKVIVAFSGIVSNFPRGWDEQSKYTSDKLEKLAYKNVAPLTKAQPGDIILYTKNKSGTKKHVLMLGDGVIYEAQYAKTYLHVNKSLKKLKAKRPKVIILRAK